MKVLLLFVAFFVCVTASDEKTKKADPASLVGYEHPLRIYFAALRDAMETVKNPDEKSLQEVQAALDFLKIWWKRPELSLKVLLEANPMLSVME
eukprot:02665.XXX_5301_6218_1 [CDS] Oithona nana genome sequencing.